MKKHIKNCILHGIIRLCSIVLFFLYSCGDYNALADIEENLKKSREEAQRKLKEIDQDTQEALARIEQDRKIFNEQAEKRQEQIKENSEKRQKLFEELKQLTDNMGRYRQLQKELIAKKPLTKEDEKKLKEINKQISEYEKTYIDILKKISEA